MHNLANTAVQSYVWRTTASLLGTVHQHIGQDALQAFIYGYVELGQFSHYDVRGV